MTQRACTHLKWLFKSEYCFIVAVITRTNYISLLPPQVESPFPVHDGTGQPHISCHAMGLPIGLHEQLYFSPDYIRPYLQTK